MYCEVNVGERIRYFRNLRGWSQEPLALQAESTRLFSGIWSAVSKVRPSRRWRKSCGRSTFHWPSCSPTHSPWTTRKKPSLHRCVTRSATSRSKASSVSMSSYGMFWRLRSNLQVYYSKRDGQQLSISFAHGKYC